ncbi:uncharacterized protein LOC141686321 [Apium graveolens]|uniref:uncharacterized protein LOC141686321 n=1 Tax=Apium graveolens TaxID=4045 RepID=UPI003D79A972
MTDQDSNWLNHPKYSEVYRNGVQDFVRNSMSKFGVGNEMKCPCRPCNNRLWWSQKDVYDHLVCNGPHERLVHFIYEVSISTMEREENNGFQDNIDEMLNAAYGNVGPNADAKKFLRLVEEGRQPLYPGCKKFSRLSFLIRLYNWKCLNGITETTFSEIIELLKEAVPEIRLPKSFNSAKTTIKDLGLNYVKIHACPNDCMLYWGENEKEVKCRNCGVSRWKAVAQGSENNKITANIMRYFPLKPRLQRMFLCKDFSKLMSWHAVDRKKDGKLRHPADGEAWKTMYATYPHYSSDNRNVRLGVTSDGFNPYRKMSSTRSIWPIVIVNYNLPPWLNMKPKNLILSTIIPGPNDPGNNIDVYIQPLITELKELWNVGVETYDSLTDQNFILHASILWTISDFPGYAMLSGWSTKGKLACPICNYETSSKYLKYSKKVCYMNHRKFLDPNHKWRSDKRRFNGDVETGKTPTMLSGREIEVLLDGYVNTFGKGSKRKKVLHPITTADGKSVIRVANFDLTNKEKDILCSVFQNAKLAHGFGSNISRCVQDRKIVGYKSHDAHIFMQYLLQIAVKKTLKPEVAIPLIRLGNFLSDICAKVIVVGDLKRLQQEIVEILCQLEMIFPDPFFDIMVHLPVHLCKEIEYGGPVHQRWMYSIERYLGVLKRYIRNKSKPEGSIAERYLADEFLNFCSRFLNDGQTTSSNQFEIPGAETEGYSVGSRKNKKGKDIHLSHNTWITAHRYVLFNYNDKEVEDLIEKHHELMANNENSKRYKRERIHADEICDWFKDEVGKKVKVSREVASLAKALTTSFASSKDQNPIVGDVGYYGSIEEIFEIDYWGAFNVVLFRCTWYQDDKDSFGFTRVNFNRVCQNHDSFVMSTQVQQVFYIEDPVEKNFYYPVKRISSEFSEIGVGNTIEDDMLGKFSHDTSFRTMMENHENDVTWFRNDVPAKEIAKEVPDGSND